MSLQNNMAKESLSLQNDILWLCSIFITQNIQIMHNPDDKPSNCSQTFSTFMQYMSVSHGHSTIGGIDGGCGEDKKEIVSHQLGLSTDINASSRDCHAMNALVL